MTFVAYLEIILDDLGAVTLTSEVIAFWQKSNPAINFTQILISHNFFQTQYDLKFSGSELFLKCAIPVRFCSKFVALEN